MRLVFKSCRCLAAACGLAASVMMPVQAQQAANASAGPESRLDVVEVTSSRFSHSVQEAPESVTVVTGDDLRDRGATDLRSALALMAGVSVYPGGDAGPAGAAPSILGRSEADDFLLLVDGVPVGGAFVPVFATLDLHNVERIEVIRASAPVFYGTTAFAGTIHVIHYAAGRAEDAAHLSTGSYGSLAADYSTVISDQGPLLQSLGLDAGRTRIAGGGVGADRLHALYRLGSETGLGHLHVDLEATAQWQKPQSPVPVDPSGHPTASLPIGFDQNPSDAKVDSDVARLVAGLDGDAGAVRWGTTLTYTRTWNRNIQGFFEVFPASDGAGFRQSRQIDELFFDLRASRTLWPSVQATIGVNELAGRVQQASESFDYTIPPDGNSGPLAGENPPNASVALHARRSFLGLYVQSRYKPIPAVSMLAGLRYNLTTQHEQAFDGTQTLDQSARQNRLSGSVGASWRLWNDANGDLDDVLLHAAYSNTFQPAQLDFGPGAGFDPLLKAETQRNVTVGIKVDGLDGRFDADLAAFYTNFDHQVLNGMINGLPALVAAGATRYRGVELETSYVLAPSLRLTAGVSVDDARYRDYNDTGSGQLAGNRLALVPRWRADVGTTYAPATGLQVALNLNLEGSRYLDRNNQVAAGAYGMLDALIGYRWTDTRLALKGTNLANRREPVVASELGEGQFYFTQRRRIELTLTRSL
jgi:iron complex outermembrane receptor protein